MRQLYTGLAALSRSGTIECVYVPPAGTTPHGADGTLSVVVNDTVNVVYDVLDRPSIDATLLARTDAYFKRSFLPSLVSALGDDASKIHPLGLNYDVCPDHVDVDGALRHFRSRRGLRRLTGVLMPLKLTPGFVPRQQYLEALPAVDLAPRALFLTRAWDPDETPDAASKIDREALNDMRANCIARLRANFGDRVLSGFAHDEYAARRFPSLLVKDPRITEKRRYLAAVAEHSICITTTGLHGSIGWKMGEYVAFAKAIVAEPLRYTVPGDFGPDTNYLEFANADECVAKVEALLSDRDLRKAIMDNNRRYYLQFVRPDRLVLNSLLTAIATQHPSCDRARESRPPSIVRNARG